jgi:hypothetical protein
MHSHRGPFRAAWTAATPTLHTMSRASSQRVQGTYCHARSPESAVARNLASLDGAWRRGLCQRGRPVRARSLRRPYRTGPGSRPQLRDHLNVSTSPASTVPCGHLVTFRPARRAHRRVASGRPGVEHPHQHDPLSPFRPTIVDTRPESGGTRPSRSPLLLRAAEEDRQDS